MLNDFDHPRVKYETMSCLGMFTKLMIFIVITIVVDKIKSEHAFIAMKATGQV